MSKQEAYLVFCHALFKYAACQCPDPKWAMVVVDPFSRENGLSSHFVVLDEYISIIYTDGGHLDPSDDSLIAA
jgi:hypothetical protein